MTHPLLAAARRYIGHPYVWGGKRDLLFDANALRLVPSPFVPEWVFDCSGLVTVATKDATGVDWRGTRSAGGLERECQPVELHRLQEGDLLFRPHHVAIFVEYADNERVAVLEAAGGDQRTTSPAVAAALKPPAFVREHDVPLSRFKTAGRLVALFPPNPLAQS